MIDDLVCLKEKFEKIRKHGWIASLREGTTGIGYTFETLIGKVEDDFPIPDFGTIEIKTRFQNAVRDITLINATPDGDYLFPIKRIYEFFSYPDKTNPEYKVFYASMSVYPKYAGAKNRFKLHINRESKKISILCIKPDGTIINPNISWSFECLEEKIYRKLKYLCIVKAKAKYFGGVQHFLYYQISFYMLRDFETFIKLMEDGIIKITFMIGVHRSGTKKGQMNNHGVAFDISEVDIEKLFTKICEY